MDGVYSSSATTKSGGDENAHVVSPYTERPNSSQSGREVEAAEALTLVSAFSSQCKDEDRFEVPVVILEVNPADQNRNSSPELPPGGPKPVEVLGRGESTPSTGEILYAGQVSRSERSTEGAKPSEAQSEVESTPQRSDSSPVISQRTAGAVEITRTSSRGSTISKNLLNSLLQTASPEEATQHVDQPRLAGLGPTSVSPVDYDPGWTRLHAAAAAGHQDLVKKLMEEGESLETAASDGRKPLLIAAENGFVKIVELLATGASVEAINDHDRSTALICACKRGHEAVVKFLIENGANIEAKNIHGWTSLLFTVASKNYNLVKYLVQHGANKAVMSEYGDTVENLAEGDDELLRILMMKHLLEGPQIGAQKSDSEPHFRYVRAPEKPKESEKVAACEAIHAEVVQFFIGHREQRSQPVSVSVYDLIYGKGPNALFNPSPTSPSSDLSGNSRSDNTNRRQPTFTWYHIPANNTKWVNDLIVRLLSDKKPHAAMPDENFRSKLGLDLAKARGKRLRPAAFSYMRPFAKSLKTDLSMSWNDENTEQAISFVPFLNYETFAGYDEMSRQLNEIKRQGFARPAIRPSSILGNPSGNSPRRLGPAPMPITTKPTPFDTDNNFSAPRPPPMFSQPPNLSAEMAPALDITATMDIRGGSGPSSPNPPPQPSKVFKKQTLAWLAGRKDLKPAIKRPSIWVGRPQPPWRDLEHVSGNPSVRLLRGYGVAEEDGQVPLQPRRTLDQYFYSHLDNTAHRDKDQVIYRYTKNEEAKIFMVDQMWLWIINRGLNHPDRRNLTHLTDIAGQDTLISCIPTRWLDRDCSPRTSSILKLAEDLERGPSTDHHAPSSLFNESLMTPAHGGINLAAERTTQISETIEIKPIDESDIPTGSRRPRPSPPPAGTRKPTAMTSAPDDPMNIQHKVLEHLKEPLRPAIESIYDLTAVIATCCASSFDENQIPEDMQFFDFFESSIGSVIEKATHSLHEFKRGLTSDHAHRNELALLGGEPTDDDLKISMEIDLLVEIEDIQDELHILKAVLRDQKRTLRQLDDILVQGRKKPGPSLHEDEIHSMIDMKCVERHMARIGEMEKLAEKAHKSLYHLIDLKQKQANFSEAISARMLARATAKNTEQQIEQSKELKKQADETARQGKTLMVFTVVTIIFLPLSFMAAFFAINIDVFPVNDDGKLEFGYIIKYMLSISLTLAIPFVLLALRINDVRQAAHGAHKGLRRALVSPRLIPFMGYTTLSLFVVVILAVVWTSKLAITAKIAITVCLAIGVLLVTIAIGLYGLINIARETMTVTGSSVSWREA